MPLEGTGAEKGPGGEGARSPHRRNGAGTPRGPFRKWGGTIGIVVGLVVLLTLYSFFFWPMSNVTGTCPCPTPISSVLSLSNLGSTTVGPHHWYNSSVLGLKVPFKLSLLSFLFRNATGVGPVYLPWVISVSMAGSSGPSATFNISDAAWTSGSTLSLAIGDTLSVDVGLATVTGYSMVIFASGNFGGTINLTLS